MSTARPCIVVGERGAMGLYMDYARRGAPQSGVLLYGDYATVFNNRRQARRAIERSARFYEETFAREWGEHVRIVNTKPV